MKDVGERRAWVSYIETEVVRDGHVLNGIVQALTGVAGFQAPDRSNGPVHAGHEFVLRHGLHIWIDGRITRGCLGRAEVHVFNEAAYVHSWGRTGCRTACSSGQPTRDRGVIGKVQRIHALVLVVCPEGAARQIHLHDVEELAITSVDLDLTIVEKVVGSPDAGSNFVTPAEVNRREARGIIGRQSLCVEANAEVEG